MFRTLKEELILLSHQFDVLSDQGLSDRETKIAKLSFCFGKCVKEMEVVEGRKLFEAEEDRNKMDRVASMFDVRMKEYFYITDYPDAMFFFDKDGLRIRGREYTVDTILSKLLTGERQITRINEERKQEKKKK